MTRPKQRPGFVREGQLVCRNKVYDRVKGKKQVCAKPVPAGELPYLACNTRSGHYLVLCLDCRAQLQRQVDDWITASVGQARLVAELITLESGHLISETEARAALERAGELPVGRRGPLTKDQQKKGLELLKDRLTANKAAEIVDI